MNSLSKFKVRLLPSLLHYAEDGNALPNGLIQGFAGLLRYYKVTLGEAGYEGKTLSGASYLVRDDAVLLETIASVWAEAEERQWPQEQTISRLLHLESVWGCDLAALWPELAIAISASIAEMERVANE
jgi:tagaturonate reductase